MYTQTPGAFHMAGAYSNPFEYEATPFGRMLGQSSLGDGAAGFAVRLPQYALTAGTAAAIGGMFTSNAAVNAVGRTLGFTGLGLAASVPVSMMAAAGAQRFAQGYEQQQFSQQLLRQTFGERNMGGVLGLGVGRNAAAQFTDMFRQLASSGEMLTNNQELKNVFSKFNDMELGKMSRSVGDVASRFKKMAETVRDMSKDLGTTLEGVMPTLQRQLQMGFLDTDQIRRSALRGRALQSVGVGSSLETSLGLQSAQASANYAAGGSKSLGATGAQDNLALINVALQKGMLTEDDIMRATGERGERGAADLAQQFMQGTRDMMTKTGYGRYLSAFLGATDKGGRFTGALDKTALQRLSTSTLEEIEREAGKKISGAGVSFTAKMEAGMGADIASQLQGGDVSRVFQLIFEKEGKDGKDAMQLMLQRVGDMRGQTAQVMLKVMEQQGRITDEVQRQFQEAAVRARLPAEIEARFSMEQRLARGARALDRALGDPLREAGAAVSRGVGGYFDNAMEQFAYGGFKGLGYGIIGGGYGDRMAAMDRSSRMRGVVDLVNRGGLRAPSSDIADAGLARVLREGGMNALMGYDRAAERSAAANAQNYGSTDIATAKGLMAGTFTFADDAALERAMALKTGTSVLAGRVNIEDKIRLAADYGQFAEGAVASRGNTGMIGALAAYVQKYDKDPTKKTMVDKAKRLLAEGREQVNAAVESASLTQSAAGLSDISSELDTLLDTSGSGGLSRSMRGLYGQSEFNQIESAHMRGAYDRGDYSTLGAINRVLMDKDLLTAVLAASNTDAAIGVVKEMTGETLNEADIAEIRAFAQTFAEKGGGLDQGQRTYARSAGKRLQDVMDRRITLDMNQRRKMTALRLQPLGDDVAQAFRQSKGAALAKGLKGKDLSLMDESTRAMLTEFSGFASQSDEQKRRRLEEMGFSRAELEKARPEDLLDIGLKAMTAGAANVAMDNAALPAAAAYGNIKDVAEIITLLRKGTQKDLGTTQQVTAEYITEATKQIMLLRDKLPK